MTTRLHQASIDGNLHLSIYEGRKLLNAQANERSVQSAICDYLRVHKIPFAVTDATEAFNRNGRRVTRVDRSWPDVTACLPNGRFLGCEVKRPKGGRLRYEQALTLQQILNTGGLIVVARSVDDVIWVMIHGVRPCDVDEIERTIARGPKVERHR